MVAVPFVAVTRQAPNANCRVGRTGNGDGAREDTAQNKNAP